MTPVTSSASTAPSASAVTPARSTCTKLTVRVLIGSGSLGTEYAAIDFVNDGSTSCTLVGVPTVTLLRNGAQTGPASVPSSAQAQYTQYELAPGATGQSRLNDSSSCNAPLSDTVKVVAPGSDITAARPGELRACKLVVYPLGAPE